MENDNVNMVLIGETGVGKSTFINAFANYLTYQSLKEAQSSELVSLIASSFTIANENFEERKIVFGQDSNEQEGDGVSKTQSCKSYVFKMKNGMKVRLIDTPGVGDTRGIEQDKLNMAGIMSHIGNYPKIHGFCFLLKPNTSRLTVGFRFAIQALFKHLHKSVCRNIVFVFTNARSTFYRPGDTFPVLKTLLEEISNDDEELKIQLTTEKYYCMDNEAFRFLILMRNDAKFDNDDLKSFDKSWIKSASECKRLVNYISKLEPHSIEDTMTLSKATRFVQALSKPLANTTVEIQNKILTLENKASLIKMLSNQLPKTTRSTVSRNNQTTERELKEPESQIHFLKLEQNTITKIRAKLTFFLKKNSISAQFFDDTKHDLEKLYSIEKYKSQYDKDKKMLLNKLLAVQNSYEKTLKDMSSCPKQENLTILSIMDLAKKLYSLPSSGLELKEILVEYMNLTEKRKTPNDVVFPVINEEPKITIRRKAMKTPSAPSLDTVKSIGIRKDTELRAQLEKTNDQQQIVLPDHYVVYYNSPDSQKVKPKEITQLLLVCPGYLKGRCQYQPLKWNCYRCQMVIEMDNEKEFVYCQCGRTPIVSCGFNCSNATHGMKFSPFKSKDVLLENLKTPHGMPQSNIFLPEKTVIGSPQLVTNKILKYESKHEIQDSSCQSTSKQTLNRSFEKQPNEETLINENEIFKDRKRMSPNSSSDVSLKQARVGEIETPPSCSKFENKRFENENLNLMRGGKGSSKCFAIYLQGPKKGNTKTEELASLVIPCPRSFKFKEKCSGEAKKWSCHRCSSEIQYSPDGYVHCSCGKLKVTECMFKCTDRKHGNAFSSWFPNHEKLIELCNELCKKSKVKINDILEENIDISRIIRGKYDDKYEEITKNEKQVVDEQTAETNIILIGETGVGKSTFINAFANYLSYDDLHQAQNSRLVSLIASSFTIADENLKELKIVYGHDPNEREGDGVSKTQSCKSYVFNTNGKKIRIIDTPGVGDTRGIAQDKRNMEGVISYISNYPKIHGICFLLKPNTSRLTVAFRSAIRILLKHLHKRACRNLVFVFTNARSTFYRPGDTFPVLQTTLEDICRNDKELKIQLTPDTYYCMDNEAFRFLVLLKNGIKFDDEDVKSFDKSWKKSVIECQRLIEYISKLQPHTIENTVTFSKATSLILALSKPLSTKTVEIQNRILSLETNLKQIRVQAHSRKTRSTVSNFKQSQELNDCQREISSYKEEQETITKIRAKLIFFLKKNSASAEYFDDTKSEIAKLYSIEKYKSQYDANKKYLLIKLLSVQNSYESILQEMDRCSTQEDMTLSRILELVDDLYKLPLSGLGLREATHSEYSVIMEKREVPIDVLFRLEK